MQFFYFFNLPSLVYHPLDTRILEQLFSLIDCNCQNPLYYNNKSLLYSLNMPSNQYFQVSFFSADHFCTPIHSYIRRFASWRKFVESRPIFRWFFEHLGKSRLRQFQKLLAPLQSPEKLKNDIFKQLTPPLKGYRYCYRSRGICE